MWKCRLKNTVMVSFHTTVRQIYRKVSAKMTQMFQRKNKPRFGQRSMQPVARLEVTFCADNLPHFLSRIIFVCRCWCFHEMCKYLLNALLAPLHVFWSCASSSSMVCKNNSSPYCWTRRLAALMFGERANKLDLEKKLKRLEKNVACSFTGILLPQRTPIKDNHSAETTQSSTSAWRSKTGSW